MSFKVAATALAFSLQVFSGVWAEPSATGPRLQARSFNTTCHTIASSISSSSHVYYPPSLHYLRDIYHWMLTSTQEATCSVEPGTAADVGIILQILGNTSTPFAVKGGGHASNPGFSSTPGVQISMTRFSEVTYNATAGTVNVGAGLIWDDVYAALAPDDVNVVGGRVTGVGVAGFTLGGGYSWLTNQHGLTVDTVQAFELVLPSGTVTSITEASNPDLFFALKGGFNNFGIVTTFTLTAYPQTEVWGGLITYASTEADAVASATATFSANVTDPKAGIITTYNFIAGEINVSLLTFYDAPTPPSGIFDTFLSIPHLTEDVSTRSFLSLVQAAPSNATANLRGIFNTVSFLSYPDVLLDAIVNETMYWGEILSLETGVFISYEVEPFLPTLFDHGTYPTAYPPDRSQALLPMNIYYAWVSSAYDTSFQDTIRESAAYLKTVAEGEGQDIANVSVYGNYAIYDTPLTSIYGSNVPTLTAIKATYDPDNVMGLCGGFKF